MPGCEWNHTAEYQQSLSLQTFSDLLVGIVTSAGCWEDKHSMVSALKELLGGERENKRTVCFLNESTELHTRD